ncbi:MAG: PAS domain-containing protein [Undibacterium sp.]|nr:PAS domain-containing protein [Undibacterium sp.]
MLIKPNEFEFFDFDVSQEPVLSASHDGIQVGQDSLTRLLYLIDNTPVIIYSSVPTGDFKMTFVSNNAQRVLGYPAEDMVKDPNFWFDHIHPEDAPAIFSSLALIFTEGQRTYEYRFRKSDGIYLWMHDTLRLIKDERGNPLEIVGSLTDITSRKQMEEALYKTGEQQKILIRSLQEAKDQLLQSEKMASIGQLAAGIAHEINNPVGFVNSNMGTLKNYIATMLSVIEAYDKTLKIAHVSEDIQAYINKVIAKADLVFIAEDVQSLLSESMDGLKRVRDIVQSLKDFSHVGENEWQIADLHLGLDSTLNIVNNELKYKAVVVKEYGVIPQVECLASQLNQVFMNMLINASHAIVDKGVITIRTGCDDESVWISISDTGSGIDPQHLNRIFDPFFTTKPVGSGTGLGLSLSYGIINKHKGRIEVSSQLGEGTCFTVFLPLYKKILET